MTPTDAFWQARKFLIANREDYERAYAGFRWPEFEYLNWALDWFDIYARGNSRTALWVATRDSGATSSRSASCPSVPTRSPTSCVVMACAAVTAFC